MIVQCFSDKLSIFFRQHVVLFCLYRCMPKTDYHTAISCFTNMEGIGIVSKSRNLTQYSRKLPQQLLHDPKMDKLVMNLYCVESL